MRKKILTVFIVSVLLVIAGGVGYYRYTHPKSVPPPEEPVVVTPADIALVGDVTDVNFEKVASDGPSRITIMTRDGATYVVAVPSMGLPTCAAAAQIADPFQIAPGDILEVRGSQLNGNEVTPCTDASHYLRVHRTEEKTQFGITFTYKKGPDGYVLEEYTATSSAKAAALLYRAVFTNTAAYANVINATTSQEDPETMSILVYENTEKLSAEQWVDTFAKAARLSFVTATSTKVQVAGNEALQYTEEDGTLTDTYLLTLGQFAYVIAGPARVTERPMAKDFETFMSSLKILPLEIVNGV